MKHIFLSVQHAVPLYLLNEDVNLIVFYQFVIIVVTLSWCNQTFISLVTQFNKKEL